MFDRIQQIGWRSAVSSCVVVGLVCWAMGLSERGACRVHAQEPADPFRPPSSAGEEDVAHELDRVRTLVLPQQKDWARKIIRIDPNSDVAKVAQELLDEYARYDELSASEQVRHQAWSQHVKAYWDARRCPAPVSQSVPLTITNATQQRVLYQMKGYAMDWSGPYRLRPGESHSFYYAIQTRSVAKAGMTVHSLAVGRNYEYRPSDESGTPALVELTE